MLAEPLLLLHTPPHTAAHNTTQHAGCCGQQPTPCLHTMPCAAGELCQLSDSTTTPELCEVLAHLDIVPGRPAHPAAIEAVQAWAELEDQLEIVEALTKDATDVLYERVNGTFADDANPSDNELELAGTENVESEGGRRLAPPPPFSELSSLFGPLEKYAESCGISGAAYHLRKAKMDFIHARSSKPAVQADIRAMFSDS